MTTPAPINTYAINVAAIDAVETVVNDIIAVATQTVPAFTSTATGAVQVDAAAAQTIANFTPDFTGGTLVVASAAQQIPSFFLPANSTAPINTYAINVAAIDAVETVRAVTARALVAATAAQTVPDFVQITTSNDDAIIIAAQTIEPFASATSVIHRYPSPRTIIVPFESRAIIVGGEHVARGDRTIIVPFESRAIIVGGESRAIILEAA